MDESYVDISQADDPIYPTIDEDSASEDSASVSASEDSASVSASASEDSYVSNVEVEEGPALRSSYHANTRILEIIDNTWGTELRLVRIVREMKDSGFKLFPFLLVDLARRERVITIKFLVDELNGQETAENAMISLVRSRNFDDAAILNSVLPIMSYRTVLRMLKTQNGAEYLKKTGYPVSVDTGLYAILVNDTCAQKSLRESFGMDIETIRGLVISLPLFFVGAVVSGLMQSYIPIFG